MSVYAVMENNKVVNLIEWDGQSSWEPPVGTNLLGPLSVFVTIGSTYENGVFVSPTPPVNPLE